MDIRRYFGTVSVKSKPSVPVQTSVKASKTETGQSRQKQSTKVQVDHDEDDVDIKPKKRFSRKRTAVIESDDEEDPIPPKKMASSSKKTRLIIEDSDDEEVFPIRKQQPPKSPKKKPLVLSTAKPLSPLKSIKILSPNEFFGSTSVKRGSQTSNFADKKNESRNDQARGYEIHEDDDFLETLKALDAEEAAQPNVRTKPAVVKDVVSSQKEKHVTSPRKKKLVTSPRKKKLVTLPHKEKHVTSPSIEKRVISPSKVTPPKKSPVTSKTPLVEKNQKPHSTQTIDAAKKETPESTNSAEKRRGNYLAYMQYKNRQGPVALGTKEIPEGSELCMDGLNFVVTGVLDSIEREQAADLIKKYGGRVQSSVCKSTNYMIVGRDSGPSKLEKAEKMGTKQITEDDFFDLIRTLPGKARSRSCSRSSSGKKRKSVSTEKKTPDVVDVKESTLSKISQLKPRSLNMGSETVTATAENSTTEPSPEPTTGPSSEKSAVDHAASKVLRPSSQCKLDGSCDNLMWVDKYKPKTIKQIIGQNGDKSNVKKLIHWLSNWHGNQSSKLKKKAFAGKWNSSDDGSGFKAALLSGPPGVGKTTSAQLVCKELGFAYVEFNASDTRSKRSLHDVVTELLRNKSLTQYAMGNPKSANKHCLLMDEVDGMAGNEDRGGVQELIQLIKNSRVPVICMCNDRNHQKIRSLANHCFDLRFQKPRVEQIKGALMSICFKEGVEIPAETLLAIIVCANQDVRQVLHHLAMWSVNSKTLSVTEATADAMKAKKDLKMGPFEVLRSVFSASDHKSMSIHDKSDLFFHDYSLSPLFVFENYLSVVPHAAQQDPVKRLHLMSRAADSICKGDLVEKLIRSENQWGLLPVEAMFASVIPGVVLSGHIGQMISFPSWLGRNSSRGKTDRLLQELHLHMRLRISGNKTDVNVDYLQHIREAVIRPLVADGLDGVAKAVTVMNQYNLLREDLDSIMDVSMWPNQSNPYSKLSSQVKAAFTRTYNKGSHTNPYAVIGGTRKSPRIAAVSSDGGLPFYGEGEEEEEDDDQLDEDVTKDAMIKAQSSKRKSKTKEASTSKKVSAAASRKKGKAC